MFRKSTAHLSLLLLAFLLLPSGKLYADSDIVIGSDPAPTGEPHPNAIDGWTELGLGVMTVMQLA